MGHSCLKVEMLTGPSFSRAFFKPVSLLHHESHIQPLCPTLHGTIVWSR
jgi:hypothetical protein